MSTVNVIGGAAIDIGGLPSDICRLRNSNAGRIRITVGGIAHNIALHLAEYGTDVQLITAIGNDFRGKTIEQDCLRNNIRIDYCLHSDRSSATYLRVYDEDYDLLTGINEMDIMDELMPPFFEKILPAVNDCRICVLDSNLPAESLDFLVHSLTVPILYEPVSVSKAKRIGDNIGLCTMIKTNRFEAAQLSGCSCDTYPGAIRAAKWFLEKGVQKVFITLGGEGILYASEEGYGKVEGEKVDVVSSAGAGDCVSAAMIHAMLEGRALRETVEIGNHAGAEYCSRWHQVESCF